MYIPDDAKFYEVIDGIDAAPLRQYREHGYDTRDDFRDALRQIVQLPNFLLILFHDLL